MSGRQSGKARSVLPPSTAMFWPVIHDDSGPAKKRISAAGSSISPRRGSAPSAAKGVHQRSIRERVGARRCASHAWAHRVDPDVGLAQFVRSDMDEVIDARLAGAVRGDVARRERSRGRRHRHEGAEARAHHRPPGVLQQQEHGLDVVAHLVDETVVIPQQDRPESGLPRHDDSHVQLAVLRRVIDRCRNLRTVVGIGREVRHLAPLLGQRGGGIDELLLGASRDGDVRTVSRQHPGRPEPDPASATEHNGALTRERLFHGNELPRRSAATCCRRSLLIKSDSITPELLATARAADRQGDGMGQIEGEASVEDTLALRRLAEDYASAANRPRRGVVLGRIRRRGRRAQSAQ